MKKLLLVLGVLFLGIMPSYSQAFVKFAEAPPTQLKPAREFFNYKIEYKALKKSTIYLELKKGDSLVGNSVYDVTKPDQKTVSVNLQIFKKIDRLETGNDYSYNLYMYEGGRNDWSKRACETKKIEGIKVVSSAAN
ncbi:hypothetical protein [Aquimarina agarivorans]|uniref:hypothetical protein n=1 Tax=Aquimarina agarivorans TaxID=980584 RepID=UPI0002E92E13|nr:hypothetical protein [Aquimarina agarivorans]